MFCKDELEVILFVRMWVEIYMWMTFRYFQSCHPLREDVSWNMQRATVSEEELRVILFVRMWVEILYPPASRKWYSMSSSSWGCELKCYATAKFVSHISVILFVRMWVEISLLLCFSRLSACHPLREDVSWNDIDNWNWGDLARHPLREDVSWNIPLLHTPSAISVILFVRMWVEITMEGLKTSRSCVILFVRMWVEMVKLSEAFQWRHCHPLREDVSWNLSYQ